MMNVRNYHQVYDDNALIKQRWRTNWDRHAEQILADRINRKVSLISVETSDSKIGLKNSLDDAFVPLAGGKFEN